MFLDDIAFSRKCVTVILGADTSCQQVQGKFEDGDPERRQVCVLCSTTKHNRPVSFCDSVRNSSGLWLDGWQLQRGYLEKENCTTNLTQDTNGSNTHPQHLHTCNSSSCEDSTTSTGRPLSNSSYQRMCLNCCTFAEEYDCGKLNDFGHLAAYFFLVGIFGMLGNAAVLITSLQLLKVKFRSLSNVQRIHNSALLSLAVSDFLMGVYLFALGFKIATSLRSGEHYDWRVTTSCTVIGVLNFVSSQVSVTMLAIMTSFRLFSTNKPYRRLSTRPVAYCITTCWIVWAVVAIVPLLGTSWLDLIFVSRIRAQDVRFSSEGAGYGWVSYRVLKKTVSCVLALAGQQCSQNYTLPETPYWHQLMDFSKRLRIYDTQAKTNFYNGRGWCAMDFFVRSDEPVAYFTLTLISYNLLVFLYIALVYGYILLKTDVQGVQKCFLKRCWRTGDASHSSDAATSVRRRRENIKMHRLIIAIIATDFLCWVPLCLAALWHAGHSSYPQSNQTVCWHVVSRYFSVLLLPFNSVINPFLHSGRIRDRFIKSFKSLCSRKTKTNVHISMPMDI